jgi:hypothetical protein
MESIFVCCQDGSFELEPGVRLRPVPEMGVCLAYTPQKPAIHRLNAASWLIVSLCNRTGAADIASAYRAAVDGPAGTYEVLSQGLCRLMSLGIIRQVSDEGTHERENCI